METEYRPLVKWAGGKRQLIPTIRTMLPTEYKRFYEPFFGGGALFFCLTPKRATINDSNPYLMNMYLQTRDNAEDLINCLQKMEGRYNGFATDKERTDYYLAMRKEFNNCIDHNELSVYSASLLVFLNKAGFNGLYRVNAKGQYNVPSAHRTELHTYDRDNVLGVSEALRNTKILTGDFENACKGVRADDFVFFDSPYYDTFDTYQAGGFSESDHVRLFHLYERLNDKGAKIMLTNNDCEFIKNLYGKYRIKPVAVKRMINCDSKNRRGREVIITNY